MKNIVCQKCGDIGYEEVLVYCEKCSSAAEHRYCFDKMLKDLCEDVSWQCEQCTSAASTLQVVARTCKQMTRLNKTVFRGCKAKLVRDVFIGKKPMKYHHLQSTFPSKDDTHVVRGSDNLTLQHVHNCETLNSSCNNTEVKTGIGDSTAGNGYAVDVAGLQLDGSSLVDINATLVIAEAVMGQNFSTLKTVDAGCKETDPAVNLAYDEGDRASCDFDEQYDKSKWNASNGLVPREQSDMKKEALEKCGYVNNSPPSHISSLMPGGCSKWPSSDILSTIDERSGLASSEIDNISDSIRKKFILGTEECVGEEEISVNRNHAGDAFLRTDESMDNGGHVTSTEGDKRIIPSRSRFSPLLCEGSKSLEFSDIPKAIEGDNVHTFSRIDTTVKSAQELSMVGKDKHVEIRDFSIYQNHVNKPTADHLIVKNATKCGAEMGVASLGSDLSGNHLSSTSDIRQKISGDAKCNGESHHSPAIQEKKSGMSTSNAVYPTEFGNLVANSITRDAFSFNNGSDHLNTGSNASSGSLNCGTDNKQGSRSNLDDTSKHCKVNFYSKNHDVGANGANVLKFHHSSKSFSIKDGPSCSAVSGDESIASDKCSIGEISSLPKESLASEAGQERSCGSQNSLSCPEIDLQCAVGPFVDAIWRGSFVINGKTCHPIMGHLSAIACEKAYTAAMSLPRALQLEKRSRLELWPDRFKRSPPTERNIALFFFPGTSNICKKYNDTLKDIASSDLSLRVTHGDVELLIFSSIALPIKYQVFNGKNYLWGVFRPNKDRMSSPSVCSNFKRVVAESPRETMNLKEASSKPVLPRSSSILQRWKRCDDMVLDDIDDIDILVSAMGKAQSEDPCESALLKHESPLRRKASLSNPGKGDFLHAAAEAGIMESAKSFCSDMNSDGLWDLVVTSKLLTPAFHSHLPRLLMNCSDPPRLVLDAISRALASVTEADVSTTQEPSCLLLLNTLRSAMRRHTNVSVTLSTKERAREVADSWKEAVLRWPDKKVKPYALAFLAHVSTFGIRLEAEKPLYQDLVTSMPLRSCVPWLAVSLGLELGFARGLIRQLIERRLFLSALNFAKEFCLLKEFPPAFFLKSYLGEWVKGDEEKQINALRVVIGKIPQFELDHPELTESNLRRRIELLEQRVHKRNSISPSVSLSSGIPGNCGSSRKSTERDLKGNTQPPRDGVGKGKRRVVMSIEDDGKKRLKLVECQ